MDAPCVCASPVCASPAARPCGCLERAGRSTGLAGVPRGVEDHGAPTEPSRCTHQPWQPSTGTPRAHPGAWAARLSAQRYWGELGEVESRPAAPALLPDSRASLVSCFISKPRQPARSPFVGLCVWLSTEPHPRSVPAQCGCHLRAALPSEGQHPACVGTRPARGALMRRAGGHGSLFISAICRLSKISRWEEQQRLKSLRRVLVCS